MIMQPHSLGSSSAPRARRVSRHLRQSCASDLKDRILSRREQSKGAQGSEQRKGMIEGQKGRRVVATRRFDRRGDEGATVVGCVNQRHAANS